MHIIKTKVFMYDVCWYDLLHYIIGGIPERIFVEWLLFYQSALISFLFFIFISSDPGTRLHYDVVYK